MACTLGRGGVLGGGARCGSRWRGAVAQGAAFVGGHVMGPGRGGGGTDLHGGRGGWGGIGLPHWLLLLLRHPEVLLQLRPPGEGLGPQEVWEGGGGGLGRGQERVAQQLLRRGPLPGVPVETGTRAMPTPAAPSIRT